MKKIKKLLIKLAEKIIKKVVPDSLIVRLFKSMIKNKTQTFSGTLIKVKKGKVRYKLLVVSTPIGDITFKLCRHDLQDPYDQVITV